MKYSVITLFPELFAPLRECTLLSRAMEQGVVDLETVHLRDFAINTQGQVDDAPYGGGGGMVVMPEVATKAVHSIKQHHPKAKVILFSPRGEPIQQKKLHSMIEETDHMILFCNRYEGVDQRFIDEEVDYEVCIGDAIYMGGEIPAMAFIEATARLLPGVLGNSESIVQESFELAGLEAPHYTRPSEYKGRSVPEVLLSGNHKAIEEWRLLRGKEDTALRRPDLLRGYEKLAKNKKPPVYLSLLHYPVVDKQGKTIASSITNLDVHDIARSVTTFGLQGYYIVHPSHTLRSLVDRVCSHWSDGAPGYSYNPNRSEALASIQTIPEFTDVLTDIEAKEGTLPRVVVTSAQPGERMISCEEFREHVPEISEPILIVFGTAWGIHSDVMDRADYRLSPIDGPTEYNHLSVRSAVAIILDRLFAR